MYIFEIVRVKMYAISKCKKNVLSIKKRQRQNRFKEIKKNGNRPISTNNLNGLL